MAIHRHRPVYFECPFTVVEIRTRTDWMEMRNWLNASERAGEWAFDHLNTHMDGSDQWTFWITDPDVAFHFKVRFA